MLAWFIEWTTQLNQTQPIAFAAVTVLTMATVGVAIAMVVEFALMRHATGKNAAPGDHTPGH